MAIGNLPLVDALKTKMRWNQARQSVLSANVANADTPRYRAVDLKQPALGGAGGALAPAPVAVRVATTEAGHIQGRAMGSSFRTAGQKPFETTPNGNAVNLEEEMLKAADNQIDFQMVTSLYQRSIGIIKTAIGKKA